MKIGYECWVTVNSDEYITSGILNCSLASAEMLREHDDGIVRVRIVPADPWQPIETAPKDGTEVLVWIPEDHCFDVAQYIKGQWCGVYDNMNPTHWQPLPPPPEVE